MHPQRLPSQSEGLPRSATRGYFQVPNSVAENLSLLAPAEKDLVIILCRRGPASTVSDRNWVKWTGKKARIKQAAIRGLQDKGLHVSGHGNSATLTFERSNWDRWIETRPASTERARTAGRAKSVTAQTGMQIHQECRERGCQRLCETDGAAQVIQFPTGEVAQPVAQKEKHPPPKEEPSPPPKRGFEFTLKAVQKHFPHVGMEFVDLLRSKITGRYTDAQLAEAVHAAHKHTQESEGLFLLTVPGRLKTVLATRSDLTESQRRELRINRQVLENHSEWPEEALQYAREVIKKYDG